MDLLEREQPLAALGVWLGEASSGTGRMVLVAGESGAGKTSLLRAFCDQHDGDAHVWWGACDALSTPRPLGPLYDVARAAGGELSSLMVGDASRHERFTGFLDALASPLRPVIVVFEDVHWADEATRDLLVFVARRVSETDALVIATYRDDEVGGDHPIRRVLGSLANLPAVRRVTVSPLSEPGVGRLAEPGDADADQIFRVTGGNPFFVTEVLAAGGDVVPETVSDAVLARAGQLPGPARTALEAASVVPDRIEVELLREVSGADGPTLDACVDAGLLHGVGRALRFRHELARLAIERAVSVPRQIELHAAVLGWLAERAGADPARLAYHAEQAGDPDAVLAHAPVAAERAARLGAHGEAHDHLACAIEHIDALDPRPRAELLERYAVEAFPVGELTATVAAMQRASELWLELGEVDRAGWLTVRRSGALWNLGRIDEAWAAVRDGIALLDPCPVGENKVQGYLIAAHLHMAERHGNDAVELATRAVEMAEGLPSTAPLLASAYYTLGVSQWFVVPDEAEATMVRALELGQGTIDDRFNAQTMMNLGSGAGDVRHYATAERWLREAITWSAERDMDLGRTYCIAWLARVCFEQGRWSEATGLLAEVADEPHLMARVTADNILGRLRVRRGDHDPHGPLESAWRAIDSHGHLQWRWPLAASRAEAAWLAGDADAVQGLVQQVYDLAVGADQEWATGELAFWLWRAGRLETPPEGAAEPFALQIEGDWRGAAAAWQELGCPYEVAVALADGDDPEELKRSLGILGRLGAAPMADRVAARLRELGVRDLPRRPTRATVDNPAGLTARQLEVLGMLVDGRRNTQIAEALHISPKTVGHHVSAILTALGVDDRHEAARVARDRGICPT